MEKKKIIVGIVGTLEFGRDNSVMHKIRDAFAVEYPGIDFMVERELYIPVVHRRKIEKFTETIIKKYDQDHYDIVFVGFSWGGVICTDVIRALRHPSISGLMAINSPLKLFGCGVDRAVPVVTFGSVFDCVVLPVFAQLHGPHYLLWSDHFVRLLLGRKMATMIAQKTKKHITHQQ